MNKRKLKKWIHGNKTHRKNKNIDRKQQTKNITKEKNIEIYRTMFLKNTKTILQ